MINLIKCNKYLLGLFFLLVAANVFGQGEVEMADAFRQSGKIYVVVAVLMIIFVGIAAFLFFLDRRINKIEKKLNNTNL